MAAALQSIAAPSPKAVNRAPSRMLQRFKTDVGLRDSSPSPTHAGRRSMASTGQGATPKDSARGGALVPTQRSDPQHPADHRPTPALASDDDDDDDADDEAKSDAESTHSTSSESSRASTPPLRWENNRYRRGTMHAMADSIYERMQHLVRKRDKRANHARGVSENDGTTVLNMDSDGNEGGARPGPRGACVLPFQCRLGISGLGGHSVCAANGVQSRGCSLAASGIPLSLPRHRTLTTGSGMTVSL